MVLEVYGFIGLVFIWSMKILRIVRQDLSCCFFVSSSDALFSFYICSQAKLKKPNFLNDFFFSRTAFARVTSIPIISSKSF